MNQFRYNFARMLDVNSSSRSIRRALCCLNCYVNSEYCWSTFRETALTTKQLQLHGPKKSNYIGPELAWKLAMLEALLGALLMDFEKKYLRWFAK